MTKSTFEDLKVFHAGIDLMVDVYRATELFPKHELYGLIAQMRRAAVSIVSNIGEGQGRLTFGEWRQMLSHARGSLFELEVQLIAAERLRYLDTAAYESLRAAARQVGGQLIGLIRYVRSRETQARHARNRPPNPQPPTHNP